MKPQYDPSVGHEIGDQWSYDEMDTEIHRLTCLVSKIYKKWDDETAELLALKRYLDEKGLTEDYKKWWWDI